MRRRALQKWLEELQGPGSERVIRFAYEYASIHGRKKVTTVHKANILKLTSGMFLEVGQGGR